MLGSKVGIYDGIKEGSVVGGVLGKVLGSKLGYTEGSFDGDPQYVHPIICTSPNDNNLLSPSSRILTFLT